jgi:uncharacterized OB-fold protein
MCRKCSKQVSDDRKICRDCGAILEEVPDEEVPGTGIGWAPASQAGSPQAAEPQEKGDEQVVGEVVGEPEEPPPPDTEAPAWKCPQCGEMVPGTFDVCWKCLTTKDGEKTDPGESVVFLDVSDVSEPDEEPEPTELYAEALGIDKDEGKRPQSVCPRCGSSKMMLGVRVCDQGEISDGRLKVVVFCFDDPLYGELKADICGHVELRVRNPKALYRHHRKSLGLQDDNKTQT